MFQELWRVKGSTEDPPLRTQRAVVELCRICQTDQFLGVKMYMLQIILLQNTVQYQILFNWILYIVLLHSV